MSLDDSLGRLQDAAWDYVAALPDDGTMSNEQLAGWAQVARVAQPLLTALDRPELMQSIHRAAAAIPARPAARATPDPRLGAMATAMQEVHKQLPPDEASRENTREVVALVVQATARTAAAEARESPNPQVQSLATELDTAAIDAHSTVTDPKAQAVPTPTSAPTQAHHEEAPAARTAPTRRESPNRPDPTQTRGRSM